MIKTGRMCPISDQLVAFYSDRELSTLNITNGSWQRFCATEDATELHWSHYLQQILVLTYSNQNN